MPSAVPWADLKPNPNLIEWLDREAIRGDGRTALVVGCGLGDDAELLAARGFRVTAFDVAPSAVAWCRRRFPSARSSTKPLICSMLLKVERRLRLCLRSLHAAGVEAGRHAEQAIARVAAFPTPGGAVLVICRGRDVSDPEGQMPWPLLREELNAIETCGLSLVAFEDFWDQHEAPPARRFAPAIRVQPARATSADKP